MLRVVIIDESPGARDLLREILEQEKNIEIVGVACDGLEGLKLVERLRPDVVTMDIHMPRMDGYAATREIMSRCPTPIVVVSGSTSHPDIEKSMESLRAGALTVIGKPGSPSSPNFDRARRHLVETLWAMHEVKVVRRRPGNIVCKVEPTPVVNRGSRQPQAVAIAASTGGPQVLHHLLSQLPADFRLPILLVQHISVGFLTGFVSWLNDTSPLHVIIAEQGEVLRPGTVYVAPEDKHLGVTSTRRISLSNAPPIEGFRPAATALFDSLASALGCDLVACILTGMGRDGVDGLRRVHQVGGYIIAQDEPSSVVYGMPGTAVEAGIVDSVASPPEIAALLRELSKPLTS